MQAWVEMFNVMNTALPVFFVIILAIILISAGRGIIRYMSNLRQPRLVVTSVIVGKRMEMTHHHSIGSTEVRADSKYYVTFEVESGERLEFTVSGHEFGQCAEGDHGKLSFQGNRYLGFQRMVSGRPLEGSAYVDYL